MATDKEKAANFFYEQCCGGFSGHMSIVPHNPALYAFCHSFCGPVVDRESFAKMLKEFSAALKKSGVDEDIPIF